MVPAAICLSLPLQTYLSHSLTTHHAPLLPLPCFYTHSFSLHFLTFSHSNHLLPSLYFSLSLSLFHKFPSEFPAGVNISGRIEFEKLNCNYFITVVINYSGGIHFIPHNFKVKTCFGSAFWEWSCISWVWHVTLNSWRCRVSFLLTAITVACNYSVDY